jgi:arylsulfatase A-like enzyme
MKKWISAFVSFSALCSGADERRPNVVIFYTDDQPTDSFGFIRGKAHTPVIDQMAKEGVYFSNAYTSSSVCSPSRYTCLTGNYASRTSSPEFKREISAEGMTKVLWNMSIGAEEWTFPKMMQQHGYQTGMVGKWHIGLTGKYGYPKPVPGNNPADSAVKAVLKANQELICRDIADRGFDYVGAAYAGNPDDDRNLVKTGCNVHAPEWQTRHALEFIEQNKDRPFMLYYATTLLHVPDPSKELLNMDPRLTPLGMLDKPIENILPPRAEIVQRARAAGVKNEKLLAATWLDEVVRTVLKKVDDLGLSENTLVILFNDNNTDDQGKGSCYQGGVHVPMIVHMPRIVKPGERRELVSNIDIAPTVLDLCGIPTPENIELDGLSLMPLLRGETVPWRDSLYLEIGLTRAVVSSDGFKYLAFRIPGSYLERPLEDRMAEHRESMEKIYRTHPWTKGVWTLDPDAKFMQMGMSPGGDFMERLQIQGNPPFKNHYYDPDQLFALDRDPRETVNLASNPEYAPRLKEMRGRLKKLLSEVPGTFAELKENDR